MAGMLRSSTTLAPPPGAMAVAALRARARAARRRAEVVLAAALLVPPVLHLLAERASGAWAAPLAVLTLVSFAVAVGAMAGTQAVWGLRAREVRRRERELYAAPKSEPWRPVARLGMACGWAVVVLLAGTVPYLFEGFAVALERATPVLIAAGTWFAVWWAVDTVSVAARALGFGPPPGDPWDPGAASEAGRVRRIARWAGMTVAVAGVLAARGRLWDPGPVLICVLAVAGLACALVTDE